MSYSKPLRVNPFWTVAGTLVLGAVLFAPITFAMPGGKAGWIHTAKLPPQLSNVLRVVRHGTVVPYTEAEGLLPCDQVKLLNANTTIHITLTNAQRIRLDALRPETLVPCERESIGDSVARLLQAITGKAESVRAATRSPAFTRSAALTVTGTASLNIPALVADKAMIAEGKRSLFVSWRGGKAPFSVEILRKNGTKPLLAKNHVAGRDVWFPEIKLEPGQYSLIITDAEQNWIREDEFHVVSALTVPAMPKELKDAKLSESARTLFYADFLVGFEDGRFTLEALQKAASISPPTPASRDWLSAWGTSN